MYSLHTYELESYHCSFRNNSFPRGKNLAHVGLARWVRKRGPWPKYHAISNLSFWNVLHYISNYWNFGGGMLLIVLVKQQAKFLKNFIKKFIQFVGHITY